jgi:hypothetical protein
VGLERGPLSLVSVTEELLERKSSGSGLESREYSRGIRHANQTSSISKNVALTSPISGGRSVGTVRSLTKATEFNSCFVGLIEVFYICSVKFATGC